VKPNLDWNGLHWGPVGTTPPMLNGAEWTHLSTEEPHSRAQGWFVLAPASLSAGKGEANWLRKNNHWLPREATSVASLAGEQG
jgi:hypothetical protein